jgi:hypothetical protein
VIGYIIELTTKSGMKYWRAQETWEWEISKALIYKTKREAAVDAEIVVFGLCKSAEVKREILVCR